MLPHTSLNLGIDVFNKAFGTGLLEKDVEQIVPVVLSRAGYERRCIEAEQGGMWSPLDLQLDFHFLLRRK